MATPAPQSGTGGRKSFDFRMSKKVAELTQVVHMLFTRNHEKEVELEALKDSYEYEIELVIRDAKSRIEALENQIQDYHKNAQSRQEFEKEKQALMQQHENELKQKYLGLETELQDQKRECQTARDLLIQAQKDIENLREGQSSDSSKYTEQVANKDKEIARLKNHIQALEKQLKDSETRSNETISEQQRTINKQNKDLSHVRELFQESNKTKEQLVTRNKELEHEIRVLRKELGRKDASLRNSAKQRQPEPKEISNASALDYAEELERLRRQVQQYRNELSNREDNFNRVFTTQKPMVVDRRAGKMASSLDMAHLRYTRDKGGTATSTSVTPLNTSEAPSGRSSLVNSREDLTRDYRELTASPGGRSTSSAGGSRLPQLGLDSRPRGMARLAKPKPLPRELLSSKAAANG